MEPSRLVDLARMTRVAVAAMEGARVPNWNPKPLFDALRSLSGACMAGLDLRADLKDAVPVERIGELYNAARVAHDCANAFSASETDRLRGALDAMARILGAASGVTVEEAILDTLAEMQGLNLDLEVTDESLAKRLEERFPWIATTPAAVSSGVRYLASDGKVEIKYSEGAGPCFMLLRVCRVGAVVPVTHTMREEHEMGTATVIVSHSSKDERAAKALVDCLERALVIPQGAVLCTSVPGYKLSVGDEADDILKGNLRACAVVIGLISRESLRSHYVVMELGASWVLGKATCPVLLAGVDFAELPGPLRSTHAARATERTDVANLIDVVRIKAKFARRDDTARLTAAIDEFVTAAASTSTLDAAGRAASKPQIMVSNDEDAMALLKSMLRNRPSGENTKAISFCRTDEELGLAPGMTKRLIERAASEFYEVAHRGDEYILFRERTMGVIDVDSRWRDY